MGKYETIESGGLIGYRLQYKTHRIEINKLARPISSVPYPGTEKAIEMIDVAFNEN